MKRILLVLLLMTALLIPAFAQEMAWVNPYDSFVISQAQIGLPTTMLSWVSRGIFYDEWDIIFRAPAELSNYSGMNLYTAYGNFSSWNGPSAGLAANNPFVTTAGVVQQNFLLGAALPLFGTRGAALAGLKEIGRTNNFAGIPTHGDLEGSYTETVDGIVSTIGTPDFTRSKSFAQTDYNSESQYVFGGGIDLGILGASVYGFIDSNTRFIGGSWTYTFTKGTDAAFVLPNNIASTETQYFGAGSAGAPQAFGQGTGLIGAVVELPLAKTLPITADVAVGWSGGLFAPGAFSINLLPTTFSVSSTNILNATSATATQTFSTTSQAGANGTWNRDTAATTLFLAPFTAGQLETNANGLVPGLDMSAASSSMIAPFIKVGVDPISQISDNVKLISRAKIGFGVAISGTNDAEVAKLDYAGVAPFDFTYSYLSSTSQMTTSTTTTLNGELGGVFEVNDPTKFVTVGAGLFVVPQYQVTDNTNGTLTVTKTKTLKETTVGSAVGATDMPATAGSANGVILVDSQVPHLGTSSYTTTTTFTGSSGTRVVTINIVVPVTVKLDFAKQKLQLIAGYDVETGGSYTQDYDTRGSKATSAVTLTNAAGTNVFTPDPTPLSVATVSSIPTGNDGRYALTIFAGTLNWMLRWMPVDALTVDIAGSSIMTAFNFSVFGSGAGFNPAAAIAALKLSATFHL